MDDARTNAGMHAEADIDLNTYTLTVEQAAAQLGKSTDTIRRYLRTGELPGIRVPGPRTLEYRLRLEDVQDMHDRMHSYAGTHIGIHASVHASEPAQASTETRANVTASVQAVIDQAVTSAVRPLAEQIERLATENGRLAAENEALHERLSALESTRAAAATLGGQIMPAAANATPSAADEAVATAVTSFATDQLWAHLAKGVQAGATTTAYDIVERQPSPAPRRSFLAWLLRRL